MLSRASSLVYDRLQAADIRRADGGMKAWPLRAEPPAGRLLLGIGTMVAPSVRSPR
jgi:hypothetical protein